MINFKHLCMAVMLLCVATVGFAQEDSKTTPAKDYKPYPYMFVSVQGGMQTTLTRAFTQSKLITPTVSGSFGAFFTPVVGARLNVNGGWNKGGLSTTAGDFKYSYNYVTTNLDLMLNVVNMFGKKDYYPVNVYVIGGIGLNTAFNNGDAIALASQNPGTLENAWDGTKLSHNARVGLQIDWDIAKHWSINAEFDANSLNDRYNSRRTGIDDWSLTAQVGITYKFGHRKVKTPTPDVTPVITDYVETNKPEGQMAKPIVIPPVQTPKNLKLDVFFGLREVVPSGTESAKVEQLAQFLQDNPKTKVSIVGYADAGTGNPTVNAKYASERVNSVYDMLVNNYGISADRIAKSSKGDTEQPFSQNDENRVVIAVAE